MNDDKSNYPVTSQLVSCDLYKVSLVCICPCWYQSMRVLRYLYWVRAVRYSLCDRPMANPFHTIHVYHTASAVHSRRLWFHKETFLMWGHGYTIPLFGRGSALVGSVYQVMTWLSSIEIGVALAQPGLALPWLSYIKLCVGSVELALPRLSQI